MNTSEQTNILTRVEWQELGFFYDFTTIDMRWRLLGSRQGLLKFYDLLITYCNDPRHMHLPAHEHYGPYMYLKIATWREPDISSAGIAGTIIDVHRLADRIYTMLHTTPVGCSVRIGQEYAPFAAASIQLEVQVDTFDPASADPLLL